MAKKKHDGKVKTADYRHTGEKRKNIPPAKIAAEGKVPRMAKVLYEYSPHLPPVLRVDPTGNADKLPALVAKAGKQPLKDVEQRLLVDCLRNQQPWLEWTEKREQEDRQGFLVDPVALHIHERVSAHAILRVAAREDVQRDLFADPDLPYSQAIQFYQHDMDWANRLILGDSLMVMTSLARREGFAGRVQMIYFDPPYGIRFGTNFQPEIKDTEVGERDSDVTREPEMVKAYRDTWHLGVHSYLSYLRDRLIAARELLSETGSIFIQISDDNVHRVRLILDEVFGVDQFVAQIQFKKTGGASSRRLGTVCDYLLWYAKDNESFAMTQLYRTQNAEDVDLEFFDRVLEPSGSLRPLTVEEKTNLERIPKEAKLVARNPIVSPGTSKNSSGPIVFEGESFPCPPGRHWSQSPEGMARLIRVGRICRKGRTLRFVKPVTDSGVAALTNTWMDLGSGGFVGEKKKYIVKTDLRVIERCILMATRPGDLILDPTCGGGSTPLAAEEWGRRWIGVDTSRVAIAISRHRILTECVFPYFQLNDDAAGPRGGFLYRQGTKLEPSDVAKNVNLDAILDNYEPILDQNLKACDAALQEVTPSTRAVLQEKLLQKQRKFGARSVVEADTRRWRLPFDRFEHWSVPFEVDVDWPPSLKEAVERYRISFLERARAIDGCVAASVESVPLLDQPKVVSGVVRVSGPFTVEGVRPEELSLGEEKQAGDFGVSDSDSSNRVVEVDNQDLEAYLSRMTQYMRTDGLTFLNNQKRKFSAVNDLFEDSSASVLHAEGTWEGSEDAGDNNVAVSFGPQYGPVTALQVEEAIRSAKQYKELVLAGFSFDPEAFAVAEDQGHPRLRVHLAQIRPDLSQAMQGLLKDTSNSQLFTVFGQPDVVVTETRTKDVWVCTLNGVEIYNPIDNTVRSSGADKVAAWFLDSDFDGRCFCITQAFFPDQNAWDKIAKALGSSADPEAFEAFKGTTSLPFTKGEYARIAVKVIDPRGNEVMAIRKLG